MSNGSICNHYFSIRLQIDENLRTIRIIAPLAFIHIVIFLPTLILLWKIYISTTDTATLLIETQTFDFRPFYFILLPIGILLNHQSFRDKLIKLLNKNHIEHATTIVAYQRSAEQEFHFKTLTESWHRQYGKYNANNR